MCVLDVGVIRFPRLIGEVQVWEVVYDGVN